MSQLNGIDPLADEEERPVFILIGRAWDLEGQEAEEAVPINILLCAPDEDAAVRSALEALASEGFAEAELDRIGILDVCPEEGTFSQAYADALDGGVAIIAFRE